MLVDKPTFPTMNKNLLLHLCGHFSFILMIITFIHITITCATNGYAGKQIKRIC